MKFAGLVLGLLVVSASSLAAEPNRPNILLVLTDDQGWATLGCYGGRHVSTPHLDQLAADGARFTDAYVTSQCTPTRATLLTGQYTARHQLWHVLSWYGYPYARMTELTFAENFPRETFTIAKGLRAAGYTTGIVGKWHLTSNADGHYTGLNPAAAHYYGFDFAPPVLSKDEFAPGKDRGVETLTSQAIEFIQQSRDKPWFCFLSHHMIHGKVVAPEALTQKYRDLGFGDDGPNRAVYLAGLECIDRSVGRLMKALTDLGEADNTLVLFLSDNGGVDEKLDFQFLTSPHPSHPVFPVSIREYDNAPLRGGKGSVYEGGVRVPLIAHWPGKIPPGTVIRRPVHAVDILPTCFDVAGAGAPDGYPLDGLSLTRLMAGTDEQTTTIRPVFQYYPFYDLRWGLTPCASIRRGDYKLIEFFGDRVDHENRYRPGHHVELYNLATDIGETRDLSASEPQRTQRLLAQLHEWMDSLNAKPSMPNPHAETARAFFETRQKPAWIR